MKTTLLKLAEAQLTGFAHASKGFSIEELATSMGMSKSEWKELRESEYLFIKDSDKKALDQHFKINQ